MKQKRDDVMHHSFIEPEQPELVKVMSWADGLEQLRMYIEPLFVRREQRERVLAYLKGLLSLAERKNGWQIAQTAGELTPYGMQRLIGSALWDADALRDSLQSYVKDQLSDTEAMLVLDEVDFPKKGNRSVGVALQFCERVHSMVNCQIAIMLAYAGTKGQVLLDRALYLPTEWADNASQRAKVGIPAGITFTTQPALSLRMLEHAQINSISAKWVASTTDFLHSSLYKDVSELRSWLEINRQSYILPDTGRWERDSSNVDHDNVLFNLPRQKWQVLPDGEDNFYGWVLLKYQRRLQRGWTLWTLGCRRWDTSRWNSERISIYRVFAPDNTTLEEMVQVLGQCRRVKDRIDHARKEVGLDQYEVRSWNGWYRHVTLSMFALAFLTAMQAQGIEQEELINTVDSLSGFKLRRGLLASQ